MTRSRAPDAFVTVGPGRRFARSALERIDAQYRRRFDLTPVGPILLLGLERHFGATRTWPDGTQLESGGWIGRLHFDNARAARVQADTRPQAGVRFARLLRDSLSVLAEFARTEARGRQAAVFEGITWLRAHGATVGFEATPLPAGPRRWLLGLHFRLLVWTFAPVAGERIVTKEVRPHRFTITRRALIESFGGRSRALSDEGSVGTIP